MQNIIKTEIIPDSRRKTILLVEDEAITSMAQAAFLTSSGYDVVTALDGDTAVSLALENGQIDLVLMDIDLGPGIDGTTAAEKILSARILPILFLTSHAEKDMVQKVKNIGRYGYVIKNSGEFVLLSSIEMAFELFEAHRKTSDREEYLEVTLQSIADCVISTDLNDRIVGMNRAAEKLTGWALEKAAGMNLYEIFQITDAENIHSRLHDDIDNLRRKIINQRKSNLVLISKNGDTFRIDKSISPIKDGFGNIRGSVLIFRDVTGEYDAQKALKERGALMHGLFENMPSGSAIFQIKNNGSSSSDYIVNDVNSTAMRLQGRTRNELVGKALNEAIPDIDRINVVPFLQRVWETGTTEYFPAKIYNDGKIEIWYDIYAFKLPTGEIVAIYNNVTGQKTAVEALRESEARYRLLAENTADNIWTMDLGLKFTYSSPSVTKLRGYSVEEALTQSIEDIVTPEYCDYAYSILKEEIAKDNPDSDRKRIRRLILEHYHKDGYTVWLESSISFMRDDHGNPIGVLGVTRDITERKRAEDALRESEEKLLLVMDGVPAYLAYVDSSERFVYVNRSYAQWHGISKEEFPGKYMRDIIEPDYYKKAEPFYKRALNGERIIYENMLNDANGVEHAARVEYVPHISIFGVLGFFAMIIDITEQKQSKDKVLSLLKEKELLLKEVHHRIKNNMGSISSLLYLQADTLENPAAKGAIQDARSRVISMMGIYDMLYRSEDYRSVSVSGYLTDLIEKISSTYTKNRTIPIEKQIQEFELDSSMLFPVGMIINELLTNALKYAFPDGKSGSVFINVHKKDGGLIEISFRDSGIGLTDSAVMAKSKGFGLSLVNMLVRQLKGELKITGNYGTEFFITFIEA